MSGLKLRPLTARDDEAVWGILKPIFRAGDTYTVDPQISRADALAYWTTGQAFLTEESGQALGTYYLKPNQGGGGAHVCNAGFATHPDAQGRGIASGMLDHALKTARDAGYRAMQFNFVVETNQGALRLWHRAGFREVGRLPGAFRHPEAGYVDALVLWKSLTDD